MKEAKMIRVWTVVVLGILLISTTSVFGQQTTTTNCTQNGNNTNCTSNTTDYSAQQQQSYETGQQIGNALGTGIAAAMQTHSFNKGLKKYCAEHPGQNWHYRSKSDGHVISSGRCPSDEDETVAAANKFMSRHNKYIPCPENSKTITDYIAAHNLDPRKEKSYEIAFKDLDKAGQLKLYSN